MSGPSSAAIAAEQFYFAHLRRVAAGQGPDVPEAVLRRALRTSVLEERREDGGTRVKLCLQVRTTDVRVRLNAVTGELISWYVPVLAENGNRDTPLEALRETAARLACPPEGAVLRAARYEEVGNRVVFVNRWEHELQGVVVEGDYIEVLLNGRTGRPFSFARQWRTPDLAADFGDR